METPAQQHFQKKKKSKKSSCVLLGVKQNTSNKSLYYSQDPKDALHFQCSLQYWHTHLERAEKQVEKNLLVELGMVQRRAMGKKELLQ